MAIELCQLHVVKRCVLPNSSEQACKRARIWHETYEGVLEKYKKHCWRSSLHKVKFEQAPTL